MSFMNDLYQQSVADNERNLRFWENYLNNLKALDFNAYADKLKVPTLVPIGSRVFFRGELKHTNEVTVALGADYFVKCSLAQAEVIRQHRIKDAESKLESFRKEREYIENQLSFTKQNVFDKEGHEILEVYTEEEDKAWREKHRENVRRSKKQQPKEEEIQKEAITDEELWNRLEELELEEELESELSENYNEIGDKRKDNSFLVSEEKVLMNTFRQEQSKSHNELNQEELPQTNDNKTVIDETSSLKYKDKNNKVAESNVSKQSKLELLQQVLDKQNQLEDKLLELKNRERQSSKTENDLMSRLDEIEQLEELEDEMDRLDDVLEAEDVESNDDVDEIVEKPTPSKLKKSISFADEVDDTSEAVEITFKHSEVEPSNEPYDKEKGIAKPSDIYEAYSDLFDSKPSSILKKSKYESEFVGVESPRKQVKINFKEDSPEIEVYPVKETIVVKDVVENPNNHNKIDTKARPTSLFKQRRMQKNKF